MVEMVAIACGVVGTTATANLMVRFIYLNNDLVYAYHFGMMGKVD